MGNSLISPSRVHTTPAQEDVASAVCEILVEEQNQVAVAQQLSRHQAELEGGDAVLQGVLYWTRVACLQTKLLTALRAFTVLLLDCIEEDLDGLYLRAATKESILRQHAGVRTEAAVMLAADIRLHADRKSSSTESMYFTDSRAGRLLKQAYPALQWARLWGDRAGADVAARGVCSLMAQELMEVRVEDRYFWLGKALDEGCPCPLCKRSGGADDDDGEAGSEASSSAGSDASDPDSSGTPSDDGAPSRAASGCPAHTPRLSAAGALSAAPSAGASSSAVVADSASDSDTSSSGGSPRCGSGRARDSVIHSKPRPAARGQELHQRRGFGSGS